MPNAPLLGGAFSARIAGVFLRRKTKQYRGVGYSYWHLCEKVRTARVRGSPEIWAGCDVSLRL